MPGHYAMVLVPLSGFCLGIYYFLLGFKLLRSKRVIANTPMSKVRSLAMGLCEVHGEVKAGLAGVLKSPFSDVDCIYYRYKIEEYKSRIQDSDWETVQEGNRRVPFLLKDETGEVFIDPIQAEIDISSDDNIFTSGVGKDTTQKIATFLKSHDLSSTNLFGWNECMRYTETLIKLGEKVFVLGTAMDNRQVDEATSEQGHLDVMIGLESNNLFYISDKSKKDCVNDRDWPVFLRVGGGAALAIASLAYYLLYKAGLFT